MVGRILIVSLFGLLLAGVVHSLEGVNHTYAVLLTGESAGEVRLGSKGLEGAGEELPNELFEITAKVIWENQQGTISFDSDTIAWLYKAVAASRSKRYFDLVKVGTQNSDTKIARYARQSLRKLKVESDFRFDPSSIDLVALREKLVSRIESQPVIDVNLASVQKSTPIENVYALFGLPDNVGPTSVSVRRPFVGNVFEERLMISYDGAGDIRFSRSGARWISDGVFPELSSEITEGVLGEDSEYGNFARSLRSSNPQVLKGVGMRYANSASSQLAVEQLDLITQRIWSDRNTSDPYLADALAWLCKTISNSGDPRYRTTFDRLSKEAEHKKLRRYAKSVIRNLKTSDVEQFVPLERSSQ